MIYVGKYLVILQKWGPILLFCLGVCFIISSIALFFLNTYLPMPEMIPAGSQQAAQIQSGSPSKDNTDESSFIQQAPPQGSGSYIDIKITNIKDGVPLSNVSLFINGKFEGITSTNGTFFIPISPQVTSNSSIRAVKDGYTEKTIQLDLSQESTITVGLTPAEIIPIKINGPAESRINVVFLPSDTAFNATDNAKIEMGGYPGGQQQFEFDARQFIANTFLEYPSVTSPSYPLPTDYEKRFNFYYFWDNSTYGDAFNGCAGSIPQTYWNKVTFSDLTILMYPSYSGVYIGSPGQQPIGCTNPNGLGRVYLKIPANTPWLAMHEIGHGLYGLMDTYCSDSTYYRENDPNPNIWSSLQKCREDAIANSWDPDSCRQISSNESVEIAGENPSASTTCTQRFWRWDPDPDIMHDGYDGTFGNASTKRIVTILDRISP